MILQRYVSKELLLTFVIAIAALMGIIFLGNAVRETKNIQGLFFNSVLVFLPYIIPDALVMSIPVAVLITCILVYGRMAAQNEITAIKASGVSVTRIVYPGLLIGLFFSLAVLYLNLNLVPQCKFEKKNLRTKAVLAFLELTSPEPSSIDLPGLDLSISYKSAEMGTLRGFSGVFGGSGNEKQNITAPVANVKFDEAQSVLILTLDHPLIETLITDAKGSHFQPTTSDEMVHKVPLSIAERTMRPCEMPYAKLRRFMKKKDYSKYSEAFLFTEKYKRFAQSLTPLLFAILAIPLGIITKKSSTAAGLGMAFIIGLVIYYPLMVLGELLGNKGALPPLLAVSIPVIFISTIAAGLYVKILRR